MKSTDHKPVNEGRIKRRPGIKVNPTVSHPVLQLQQLVGNKAVTKMIQRHPDEFTMENKARIEHNSGQISSLQTEVAGLKSQGSGGGASDEVVVPAAGGF